MGLALRHSHRGRIGGLRVVFWTTAGAPELEVSEGFLKIPIFCNLSQARLKARV